MSTQGGSPSGGATGRRASRLRRLGKVVLIAVALGLTAQCAIRYLVFRAELPEDALRGATLESAGDGVRLIADELDTPWGLAFLPGGDFLVTERPGRLVRLAPDGTRRWSVEVPGVDERGEGGLLGLALSPGFAENGRVHVYLTTSTDNRIVRYRVGADGALDDERVLLAGIPAAGFHNGGRIAFGPDGLLYATTGDAGLAGSARDPGFLGGKILRLTEDGAPAGSPEGSYVHSLGHRNPQGLAWDPDGRLWSTEHGRSGTSSGLDELNLVTEGGDYGWPTLQGDASAPGVTPPVLHSGADATWAPSGAAWLAGRVLFGGLRGQALYDVRVEGPEPVLTAHFFRELGRLRTVHVGPDGALYLLTGNRDGRGRTRPADDELLRVEPGALRE